MIKRNFAVLLVTGLVLGGGALALAQGQPDRPSPEQGGPGREQFGKGGHGAGFIGRAVHGDLVVRGEDGKFENVSFDKGTVHADSDGSKVVIDRPDGKQVTLELTPETRYRGVAGAAQLREGRPAMVASRDGKALMVAQRMGQRDGPEEGPGAGNKNGPPAVPKN
ncbi:MAG: hypothetical protein M3N31_04610 [Actinomycetota bacterium]|nr:hypothetical protein [Actinomycetota bacterium]